MKRKSEATFGEKTKSGWEIWITTERAAEITGRDASTIRRWVSEGHLKARRISKRLNLVSVHSVEKMIEKRDGRWNRTAEVN